MSDILILATDGGADRLQWITAMPWVPSTREQKGLREQECRDAGKGGYMEMLLTDRGVPPSGPGYVPGSALC